MDREALQARYQKWLRCCRWIEGRVDTTAASLTPDGLCPFLATAQHSVAEIRRRSDELGPMIVAIIKDADQIGMSMDELAG